MHFVRSSKRAIGMKYTVASLALVSLLLSACGGRDNNDGNGKIDMEEFQNLLSDLLRSVPD